MTRHDSASNVLARAIPLLLPFPFPSALTRFASAPTFFSSSAPSNHRNRGEDDRGAIERKEQVYTADTQVSHRVTANHDLQHPYPSPLSSTGITNSTPGNRAHRRQAISSGPEKAIRRCIDGVMTKITIPRVRALYPIMQIDRSARGRQFHRERSIDSAPFEDHVSCRGSRFSSRARSTQVCQLAVGPADQLDVTAPTNLVRHVSLSLPC